MEKRKTERLTTDIFIMRGKEIYGDKYTYEKSIYINNRTPVIITCPIHGDFEKKPTKFINSKQGCPKCSKYYKPSTEEWIKLAQEKHGNKFNYDKVVYKNRDTEVIIICPEHGEFSISPREHLKSTMGCPKCYKDSRLNHVNMLDFFSNKHGNYFDYSKSVYNGSHNKITITCPEHGEFETTPSNHIEHNNGGCPKCSHNYSPTTEEWIKKCNIIHNHKYDYSKSEYIDAENYTTIICPEHGEFTMNARQHSRGQGCPKCNHIISKKEIELQDFIKELISDNTEVLTNNRKILNGKELDIYIPSKKIAFEFNGLYWHCDDVRNDKKHLLEKTNLCLEHDIQLIHIFEDEWRFKNEICKSRIKNILGYSDYKVYARKCHIKKICYNEVSTFLNNNHIQGTVSSKYNYGLYYNNELVSIMTFGKLRKNLGSKHKEGVFEMLRFCNKLGYSVVGGASKLLKQFIEDYNPIEIISYADRRWSNGNLYNTLGFEFIKNTDINYFYLIDGNKRINRFSLRKDILISKYGCPPEISERDFCKSKGWFRVYDCGCKLYSLKLNKAGQ